jgi:hypothetical protein
MRPFQTLAIGLAGAAIASASDVSSLTKDTFNDFVKEHDLALLECKYYPGASISEPSANSFVSSSLRSMSLLNILM